MTEEMAKSTVVDFDAAYADCVTCPRRETDYDSWLDDVMKRRDLHYHGPWMEPTQAAELFGNIEAYNNFTPQVLIDFAKECTKGVFAGRGEILVQPAREYSVCVYIQVPLNLHQEVENYVNDNFGADEVDWQGTDTLRVWWD